ncbi:MAG: hypothetical protein ACLQT6_09790 [Desulfomonilaceae bacterium]
MPGLGYIVDRIDYEPLPDYLWHAYLPKMWHEEIWPAQLSRRALPRFGPNDDKQAILHFIGYMQDHGVKWLYGVPGHTLYVVLRKDNISVKLTNYRRTDISPVVDGKSWEVRQIFDVLTGLSTSTLSAEDDTWFRQIKAAAVFSVLHGRETDLQSRESSFKENEENLLRLEKEISEREQRYESFILVRLGRRLKYLFNF